MKILVALSAPLFYITVFLWSLFAGVSNMLESLLDVWAEWAGHHGC